MLELLAEIRCRLGAGLQKHPVFPGGRGIEAAAAHWIVGLRPEWSDTLDFSIHEVPSLLLHDGFPASVALTLLVILLLYDVHLQDLHQNLVGNAPGVEVEAVSA